MAPACSIWSSCEWWPPPLLAALTTSEGGDGRRAATSCCWSSNGPELALMRASASMRLAAALPDAVCRARLPAADCDAAAGVAPAAPASHPVLTAALRLL
eukprot:scaffold184899_cov14-Tisochrysis_lutea.AAC.2